MDDAALAGHLRALEESLLLPEVRASRARLEELLAPDFREFGASGRVYDRPAVIALLAGETQAGPPVVRDMALLRLAPDVALLTYRSLPAGDAASTAWRAANRSSIWRRDLDGSWRMVFHQGTRTA